MSTHHDAYFLGGADLEMATIREVLASRGQRFHDKGLSWRARASDYASEITAEQSAGNTPVLIELFNDLPEPIRSQVIEIDHHGQLAGADSPTALEQILSRLGISRHAFQSDRWWQLVAANDRGHILGMRSLTPPATDEEIGTVRLADLQTQGITDHDRQRIGASLASRRNLAGGRLTVLNISDNRTSLAAELMETYLGGPGFQNLLVNGSDEVALYGEGRLVAELVAASPEPPESWSGGSLPAFGFWGALSEALDFNPESLLLELLGGSADWR